METDENMIPLRDLGTEMFDLFVIRLGARPKPVTQTHQVGVMVRGANFHSGGKVEDNTIVMSRPRSPPSGFHGFTYLNSKVRFRL
jgi:hypothetical protein